MGLFFLGVLLLFGSIFMMLLILVQRGKGGGLTGALGGMGGQSAFGTKAGDVFTRVTVITAMVWITLCMVTIAAYNPPPRPPAQPTGSSMSAGAGAGAASDEANSEEKSSGDAAVDAMQDAVDAATGDAPAGDPGSAAATKSSSTTEGEGSSSAGATDKPAAGTEGGSGAFVPKVELPAEDEAAPGELVVPGGTTGTGEVIEAPKETVEAAETVEAIKEAVEEKK